jgi:hypothetical protein
VLSRFVAISGYVAALVLLFAITWFPWLQLVLAAWVLAVSVNILVLSYRRTPTQQSDVNEMTA